MTLKDEYVGAHHEYLGTGRGRLAFWGELFIKPLICRNMAKKLPKIGARLSQNAAFEILWGD